MRREYQISCREILPAGPDGREHLGKVEALIVEAANEAQARKAVPGYKILAVWKTRTLFDADQQWFRVEEACEYLGGMGESTFYEKRDQGYLPAAKDGNPLYHRSWLDKLARANMTKVDFIEKEEKKAA